MKDYNHKDGYHSGHLDGMEAKHARKQSGAFYHNVMAQNILKKGGKKASVKTAHMSTY